MILAQAQEQDALSEADFEEDPTDDDDDGGGIDGDGPIPDLRGIVNSRGQGVTGHANDDEEEEEEGERRPRKRVRT